MPIDDKPKMTTPDSTPVVPDKKPEAQAEDPFKGFITKAFDDGKELLAPVAGEETEEDESAEEAAEDAEAAEEDAEAAEEPKPRSKKSVQARIAELTKARRAEQRGREAERAENDRLRARVAQLEGSGEKKDLTDAAPKSKANSDGRPDATKYEFGQLDEQFISDLADWKVDQRLASKEAEAEARKGKAAQDAEIAEQETQAMSLLETGLEKFGEEFDTLVIKGAQNGDWALSDTLGKLVGASEYGADIALHLARDPKEALKVYRLPPMEQAAYFGRMEARFSSSGDVKPKKVQAPKAPPPPETKVRGAGGKFSVSADTTDFAAFESMANAAKH